jgi:hypothetical protein
LWVRIASDIRWRGLLDRILLMTLLNGSMLGHEIPSRLGNTDNQRSMMSRLTLPRLEHAIGGHLLLHVNL